MNAPLLPTAPFRPADRSGWIYGTTLVALVVLPTLLALRFPPRLGNDAALLSLSWNHLARTGELCRMPVVDAANLAHDTSVPLTWWTPGPVLAIGALSRCGLSWGQSIAFWLGLTSWLQLAGWRRLYRDLGFSPPVVALSLVMMAASWHSLYSYRCFLGGDMFAAAVLPWATLALIRATGAEAARLVVSYGGFMLLGIFFKLSFFITATGIAFGVWLHTALQTDWRNAAGRQRTLRTGLLLSACFCLVGLLVYGVFLRHGTSPADSTPLPLGSGEMLRDLALPVALPFSSLLSFTSLGGRLCDVLGWAHPPTNIGLVAAAAALALVVHVRLWRQSTSPRSRALVAGVSFAYAGAFACLYLRTAAVSYEDRLFAPCGWFLLPALLTWILSARSNTIRAAGLGVFALGAAWGLGSYVFRVRELARADNCSARGYSLWALPSRVEQAVQQVERQTGPHGALFLSPDIEPLLVISRHPAARLANAQHEIRGQTSGSCIVILPPGVVPSAYLAQFKDYTADDWDIRQVEHWSICLAPPMPLPSAPK